MDEKQDTISDIAAKMRGLVEPGETLEHTYELLNGLADRIEAAHKREVEAITAKIEEARHCWKVWSDRADELKNKCDEQYAQLKSVGNADIGNAAKMREALEQIASIPMPPPIHLAQQCAREMREKAIAALAEPARNCDRFGTDNAEASLAYEEFCDRAEVEESVNGAIAWLLSLDTDKEGGAK